MLDTTQLAQAVSEVVPAITDAVVTHLTGYGVEPDEANEIGTTIAQIAAVIYNQEFSGEDSAEEATEPDPNAPDNLPAVSDTPAGKRFTNSILKVGATWSAKNKAIVDEINSDTLALSKKVKGLHSIAFSIGETSTEPEVTKAVETSTEPTKLTWSQYLQSKNTTI
jgi:hypothetical protein